MPKAIQIRVPGSSANLGPGYDTLGIAINLYLSLRAETINKRPVLILKGEGSEDLPRNSSNLIYRTYQQYGTMVGRKLPNLKISVENAIPLKRGLGSSSAAIVAGLLLGKAFSGQSVSQKELVNMASKIEGHPDNVTPCLVGGITISCNVNKEIVYHSIRPPHWLNIVAVIPELVIETRKARAILPKSIPLKDAVFNIQRVALQVAQWYSGKNISKEKLFEDRLHQKYRKSLIPGFSSVIDAALSAGASGTYLSGSGPTIIALFTHGGEKIGNRMVKAFFRFGLSSRYMLLKPVISAPRVRLLH